MGRQLFLLGGLAASLAMSLAGCGKEEAHEGTTFDAAFVAAEADKGDLGPLKALVDACHAEVKSKGRRDEVCKVLDDVGPLLTPLNIRF